MQLHQLVASPRSMRRMPQDQEQQRQGLGRLRSWAGLEQQQPSLTTSFARSGSLSVASSVLLAPSWLVPDRTR